MHARNRYSSAFVLLLTSLLLLAGCNRHAAQNSANGSAVGNSQQVQPSDQGDNSRAPANSAPTLNNSEAATNAPPPSSNQATAAPAGRTTAYAGSKPDAAVVPQSPAQPVIVPAGTSVVVRLQQSLSSASAVPGERFEAVLDQPLVVDNEVVAPVGTPVTGHVTLARRSGRLRHPGELGLTLDSVTLGQQRVRLITSSVVARGGSHKKRNWGWIGGGTGGGALIGALAGGGKGALIGGGIGAAAGTTTALITGKKDVSFGAERRLTFRLHQDLNL